MTDPHTNQLVSSAEDIKCVSLNDCTNLLTNRPPKNEYKEDLEMKNLLHDAHMQEVIEDDIENLSWEQFWRTILSLKEKKSSKYEFLLKGGHSVLVAIFHLCKAVWSTEHIPTSWHKSSLIQLFKGKGKGERSILDNYRHIHLKDEVPKVFGDLVMSAARDKLYANMSKFQIGAKPGHRPQEHLYVLKSIIGLYLQQDKAVYLSMGCFKIF